MTYLKYFLNIFLQFALHFPNVLFPKCSIFEPEYGGIYVLHFFLCTMPYNLMSWCIMLALLLCTLEVLYSNFGPENNYLDREASKSSSVPPDNILSISSLTVTYHSMHVHLIEPKIFVKTPTAPYPCVARRTLM